MRTAQIRDGKFLEAIAWGKETAAYAEKKFGTAKIGTWIDCFGDLGTIRWTVEFPDMGALDKAQVALLADADYWKLIKKAADAQLFIDGRTTDHVYREL
jgi:hypothetical protein